ncbi:MAG: hypothetical protein ACTS47_02325 [Candidatus Hodgkinia cicadicola]
MCAPILPISLILNESSATRRGITKHPFNPPRHINTSPSTSQTSASAVNNPPNPAEASTFNLRRITFRLFLTLSTKFFLLSTLPSAETPFGHKESKISKKPLPTQTSTLRR